MQFENSWGNKQRADSYSKLEFPNTYHLAYRDLPAIISNHVKGKNAIDFGCGAGRSTRFLKKLGFDVKGIDISSDMINKAQEFDSSGDYQIVTDGNYLHLGIDHYDLIQSIFTFDNIAGWEKRIHILKSLSKLLNSEGNRSKLCFAFRDNKACSNPNCMEGNSVRL